MSQRTYYALQVFAGIGGGCLGFQQAAAEFRGVQARFETLAAIDSDPVALADLEMLTGAPGVVMDLFTREDYEHFHGKPAPEGWREVTPADIRAACGGRRPDVVFGSPPCKGFSGLLSSARSNSAKYQALNRLVVRWLFLVLEAFADDPPGLLLLENVPRIQGRGRDLLDRVQAMLASYGYASAETTHDCGELGGLAQTRKRFLLVARRTDAVDALLYEPVHQRLKTIGDVVGPLALPEAADGGAMHTLPRIQRRTWERLALIRAGKDWRDLERRWAPDRWRFVPRGGREHLVEFGEGGRPVGNPHGRRTGPRFNNVARVAAWDEASRTVTGGAGPSSGGLCVADPRPHGALGRFSSKLRVEGYDGPAHTVIGAMDIQSGALSLADPRLGCKPNGATLRVVPFDKHSPTVIGTSTAWTSGSVQVADPRLGCKPRNGTMGVRGFDDSFTTVTGNLDVHAGTSAVADPRSPDVPVIISDDGCWHRPLTTLELAALQSFPVLLGDKPLVLTGKSASRWRMGIGNAVPPATARAIGEQMLRTLLVSDAGAFALSEGGGIWVREADGVLRWHRSSRVERPFVEVRA